MFKALADIGTWIAMNAASDPKRPEIKKLYDGVWHLVQDGLHVDGEPNAKG